MIALVQINTLPFSKTSEWMMIFFPVLFYLWRNGNIFRFHCRRHTISFMKNLEMLLKDDPCLWEMMLKCNQNLAARQPSLSKAFFSQMMFRELHHLLQLFTVSLASVRIAQCLKELSNTETSVKIASTFPSTLMHQYLFLHKWSVEFLYERIFSATLCIRI